MSNWTRNRGSARGPPRDAPGKRDAVEKPKVAVQTAQTQSPQTAPTKTGDLGPRKIIPVPGVMPHLWHKYQSHPALAQVQTNESLENAGNLPTENIQVVPTKSAAISGTGKAAVLTDKPAGAMRDAEQPPKTAGDKGKAPGPPAKESLEGRSGSGWPGRADVGKPRNYEARPNRDWEDHTKVPPINHSFVLAKKTASLSADAGTASSVAPRSPISPPAGDLAFRPGQGQAALGVPRGPAARATPALSDGTGDKQATPNLVAYRAPRPNKNYSGSSPSLPSLSTRDNNSISGGFVIDNSDDNGERAQTVGKDIRNEIAPAHLLKDCGNTWVLNDWGGQVGAADNVLTSMSFLGQFILSWISGIPARVDTTFLRQPRLAHWDCDVDTDTGRLCKPVEFPSTMIDLAQMSQETAWRQQNWTSSLLMRREDMRLNQSANRRGQQGPPRRGPPRGWTDTPVAPVISPHPRTDINYEAESEREPNPYAPTISCHLRPARADDMEGVQVIYNLEVEKGLQALDTEPLSVESFVAILQTTQRLGMPFVVCVSGPAPAPPRGRRDSMLYSSTRRQNQPSSPLAEDSRRVLAFGYLAPWEPGLAGGVSGRSRMTARAHVYVHPEHRRKKLGHACLDKILSTASARYSTKLGCEFVNARDDPVYKYPHNHARKYHSVYLCLFVKTQSPTPEAAGAEEAESERLLGWAERYLRDNFRVDKVARFEAFHRRRLEGPAVPDWLDMVIFRHICEVELDFTRS